MRKFSFLVLTADFLAVPPLILAALALARHGTDDPQYTIGAVNLLFYMLAAFANTRGAIAYVLKGREAGWTLFIVNLVVGLVFVKSLAQAAADYKIHIAQLSQMAGGLEVARYQELFDHPLNAAIAAAGMAYFLLHLIFACKSTPKIGKFFHKLFENLYRC